MESREMAAMRKGIHLSGLAECLVGEHLNMVMNFGGSLKTEFIDSRVTVT
jgi:hypothetical protein